MKITRIFLLSIFCAISLCTVSLTHSMEITHSQMSLYEAAKSGDLQRVEQLLHDKKDVNKTNNFGWTPLSVAAFMGHEKVVEILCKHNADVNQPNDDDGWTPLYAAAFFGHEKIVVLLCKSGANFKKNTDGLTPLHAAVVSNAKKQIVIDLVFFFGKSILSIENNQKETALDFAQAKHEIVELLSDETLLDQEIGKRRKEFFEKEMKENCLSLNPLALLAGREIGLTPLQIKLEKHKHLLTRSKE